MRSIAALSMLFVLPMFVGCGANSSVPGAATAVPSEDAAKQALQDKLSQLGKMKLVAFQKTNGQGVPLDYIVAFGAEVEFTADSCWDGGMYGDGRMGGPLLAEGEPDPPPTVKAGQRVEVEGTVRFGKTEKGWMSRGVYFDSPKLLKRGERR